MNGWHNPGKWTEGFGAGILVSSIVWGFIALAAVRALG